MAHLHDVYDSDMHFLIDISTRIIKNTTSKNKLIQYDHNSERFTFEIPRYIENHDMSLCNKIEIHYINISSNKQNESKGVYLANDLQISPDDNNIVIFSWLVSGNATEYAGTLNFLIRFVCLDGSDIEYAWHTEIFKEIAVADGMNNDEAVITEFPDILEAWKKEIISEGISGGTKLYRHDLVCANKAEYATIISTQETPFTLLNGVGIMMDFNETLINSTVQLKAYDSRFMGANFSAKLVRDVTLGIDFAVYPDKWFIKKIYSTDIATETNFTDTVTEL